MAARAKLPFSFFCAARSFSSQSISFALRRPSPLIRFRPLLLTSAEYSLRFLSSPSSSGGLRSFSARPTTSSLNDPSPNWSNRPPKETILLDGCDFEHWLIVMEPPEPSLTRDEIIDYYIKTLAQVLGSEEEARMSIYSVSTKHYFAFGAKVSEEISYKIKPLPKVRWVLPDSYLDVKNKDYGGEPFIDGKAVPYDPKYHEEWVRNNARANERSRRNDRPRNFDRSRNFERRRENRDAPPMSTAQNAMPPRDMPPNAGPEQGYQNQMPNPQSSYAPNVPNPQSSYAPNVAPGYQSNAQGYQGGPVSNGSGYPGGNSGYQGGNPSGNVTGGPSYQGSNPGYQGNPGGNMAGRPGYQGGNPAYPGGNSGYQGGNPSGNVTGGPGYHGSNPGYRGNPGGNMAGGPGFQGGNPVYPGGNPGYQGGNPGGNMSGGPSYQGGPSGYQGQNAGYQRDNADNQGGGSGYTQNFRDGQGY